MRGFVQIISLELKSLVRSKTLVTLLVLSVLWMLSVPWFVRGDGTADGMRELLVRFSLGGVFILTVIALLAAATGSLAHERTARRLQLTMVRPVRYFTIVIGKIIAHVAVGGVVMAVACAILAFKANTSRTCSHVLSPILPSVREEAKAMYEVYMNDPQTPDAVRHAKREIVMRLLENRAIDHYQTIATNGIATWRYPLDVDALDAPTSSLQVRMRFAAQFDMRQDVRGEFRIGRWRASVSNITQAVTSVPLEFSASSQPAKGDELTFRNDGLESLMLRPRRDLSLLVSADCFGFNLIRAYVVLMAVMTLVVSCGLFLSAGLGRPVALFVAFATLIVSELAPSVVGQCSDELDAPIADRIGIVLARTAAEVTRPLSSASPIDALSKDECIEVSEMLRCILVNVLVLPTILSLIAAVMLPRKQGD